MKLATRKINPRSSPGFTFSNTVPLLSVFERSKDRVAMKSYFLLQSLSSKVSDRMLHTINYSPSVLDKREKIDKISL